MPLSSSGRGDGSGCIYFYSLFYVGVRAAALYYSYSYVVPVSVAVFMVSANSLLTLIGRVEKNRKSVLGHYDFDSVMLNRLSNFYKQQRRVFPVLLSRDRLLLRGIQSAYSSKCKFVDQSYFDNSYDGIASDKFLLYQGGSLPENFFRLSRDAVSLDQDYTHVHTAIYQLDVCHRVYDDVASRSARVSLMVVALIQATLALISVRALFPDKLANTGFLVGIIAGVVGAYINYNFKKREARASFMLLADRISAAGMRVINFNNILLFLFLIAASAGASIYYGWYAFLIANAVNANKNTKIGFMAVAVLFGGIVHYASSYFITRDAIKNKTLFLYKINEGQVEKSEYWLLKKLFRKKKYFTLAMIAIGYLLACLEVLGISLMPFQNTMERAIATSFGVVYAINHALFLVNANVAATASRMESEVAHCFEQPSLLQRARERWTALKGAPASSSQQEGDQAPGLWPCVGIV